MQFGHLRLQHNCHYNVLNIIISLLYLFEIRGVLFGCTLFKFKWKIFLIARVFNCIMYNLNKVVTVGCERVYGIVAKEFSGVECIGCMQKSTSSRLFVERCIRLINSCAWIIGWLWNESDW